MPSVASHRREMKCFLQLLVIVAYVCCLSVGYEDTNSCKSDEECQRLYKNPKTKCLPETRTCSNPFQEGCLKAMNVVGYTDKLRVCNSNDDRTPDNEICSDTKFPYMEIRIHQGKWESSFLLAWIYQIVLTELSGVPATVGLTTELTKVGNFYSSENKISASETREAFFGLKNSVEVEGGCTETEKPCVHVLPEVWSDQRNNYDGFIENQTIGLPSPNGMLSRRNFFIPTRTARQHPELVSFYGYQGEVKRELLVSLFKKPTTWKEYCESVSGDNCTSRDITAPLGYPNTTDQQGRYFEAGQYNGHFRATGANTGYIVGPSCDSSQYVDGQLYYNNITALTLDGPLGYNNGYSMSSMEEIWTAAAYSKSHVIMWWHNINELQQHWDNTDFSFQQVLLPKVSDACLNNRPTVQARCNNNIDVRRGNKLGACDYETEALLTLMSIVLVKSNDNLNEVDQSPARNIIRDLNINEYEMSEIIENWVSKKSPNSADDEINFFAREAVCEWVVENLKSLEKFVPSGYPKEIIDMPSKDLLSTLAKIVAVFTGCATCAAILLTLKYKRTKAMVFAQPVFMLLILFGFLCLSTGAFVQVLPPTTLACIAVEWLTVLGYSVTLVPVLVKVAAINRLMAAHEKASQRVNINLKVLMAKVVLALSFVVAGLLFWTFFEEPEANYYRQPSIDDSKIVYQELQCDKGDFIWSMTQIAWESILLVMAAALAYQYRGKMVSVIHDYKSLRMMVYSHVVFLVFRGGILFLEISRELDYSIIAAMYSFNYSLDAIFAMSIYIYPKLFMAMNDPEDYSTVHSRGTNSSRSKRFPSSNRRFGEPSSFIGRSAESQDDHYPSESVPDPEDMKLRILICSGNLGNAEPTTESMMAWIPTDGACELVHSLDNATELETGTFDLIVIGMQESTWRRPNNDSDNVDQISDRSLHAANESAEEIFLASMVEQDTARLRQSVRDILGEDYRQVVEETRGQMRLHIWCAERVLDEINNIRVKGANTGVGNVLNNKGGIVVTFEYRSTELTFISAHLAAHEGETYFKTRLKNVRSILKEAKTSTLSRKLDVATSSHHVFMMGDLNFRSKFSDELDHNAKFALASDLIKQRDYEKLYAFDELQKALEDGALLDGFTTLPCSFPPTFKVERKAGFIYKDQRIPSYTDRILFKSSECLESNLRALAYEPCEGFVTSDHKPIRGAFSILPNMDVTATHLEAKVHVTFRDFLCTNLPATDSNGLADPYVMVMWDTDILEEEAVDFKGQVRKLFLRGTPAWPRTKYKPKTLNPDWKGTEIKLATTHGFIGPHARVYLVVVDFDALSKDDFMCVVSLNLGQLLSMERGERARTKLVDRNLVRFGRKTGRIRFRVDVKRETHQKRRSIFGRSKLQLAVPLDESLSRIDLEEDELTL